MFVTALSRSGHSPVLSSSSAASSSAAEARRSSSIRPQSTRAAPVPRTASRVDGRLRRSRAITPARGRGPSPRKIVVPAAAASLEADTLPPQASGTMRLHYHRPEGGYEGWGLHVWGGVLQETTWDAAMPPTGSCGFGLYWDVPVAANATEPVGFLVHKGEEKDTEGQVSLPTSAVWVVAGRKEFYGAEVDPAHLPQGDIGTAAAHWVTPDLIAWRTGAAGRTFKLHTSYEAGLKLLADGVDGDSCPVELTFDPNGLPEDILAASPYLAGCSAFRVPPEAAKAARTFVKAQLAISACDPSGRIMDATSVQIAKLLDHEFAYEGPLGANKRRKAGEMEAALWAPTAHSVDLLVFDSPSGGEPFKTVTMTETPDGVWRASGPLHNCYYQYQLTVIHPYTGKIERPITSDPYSRALSANGERTFAADMDDPSLMPPGWGMLGGRKPTLERFTDASIYELHVRDFSASDPTVPSSSRGKYMAFAETGTDGMRHLEALASSGLTHLHLLPSYDFGSVPERGGEQRVPEGDLSEHPPASELQQAAVMAVADQDAFNWGYDPVHYGVPEGSYASDPDGTARIKEFRSMVDGINRAGLRVVCDVVYNHTYSSGPHDLHSVLDKCVPGYYHRRNERGEVEASTCANNTASENYMMDRLIVDDLLHWARTYKVDGFRFDLMGHIMMSTMTKARRALDALTLRSDGVDGKMIYLYGEGWEFGEIEGGMRGVTACQGSLAGSGIGSFNDRLREGANGGSPFGDPRLQGFLTGLSLQPAEGVDQGTPADQEGQLRWLGDALQYGMAANLRSFPLLTKDGEMKKGEDVGYGGTCPLAYAGEPAETVNYVSAHDNETLFDTIMLKSNHVGLDAMCRINHLAMSLVGLSQGVPFFHAGDDLLRSKSLDRDSYNSGDWFNRLDWSGSSNNFGVGLPPASKNEEKWPMHAPLLSNPDLTPGPEHIARARDHMREILAVRKATALLRLPTASDVASRVTFHNSGPAALPGAIVMQAVDGDGGDLAKLDESFMRVVVVINARPDDLALPAPEGPGGLELHPVLAASTDPVVRTCCTDENYVMQVPARTAAVFVARR